MAYIACRMRGSRNPNPTHIVLEQERLRACFTWFDVCNRQTATPPLSSAERIHHTTTAIDSQDGARPGHRTRTRKLRNPLRIQRPDHRVQVPSSLLLSPSASTLTPTAVQTHTSTFATNSVWNSTMCPSRTHPSPMTPLANKTSHKRLH
jgi:hypothetical protein